MCLRQHCRLTPSQSCRTNVEPDAIIWLVVSQKTEVQPHMPIIGILDIVGPAVITYGSRNELGGGIRSTLFRPGTIRIYALWTEQDEVVATSAPVDLKVSDEMVSPKK